MPIKGRYEKLIRTIRSRIELHDYSVMQKTNQYNQIN